MPQIEVSVITMKDAVNVLVGRLKEGPDAGKWVIPSAFVNEGEHMIDCAKRVCIEEAGIVIEPKQVLFLSESLTPTHRVSMFCYGEYVSGEPSPGASLTEVVWVDPRKLGEFQKEGMSDMSQDAFYKFSLILKGQAAAAPRSGTI